MAVITQTARLIRAIQRAYLKKWSFLAAFLLVLFVTYAGLVSVDFVPDPIVAKTDIAKEVPAVTLAAAAINSQPELPSSIEIPSINLKATIANPDTTNVETLDKALLNGAVRYPTSAKLGEKGNVIVFGHSSYLPIVHNQAYKTFDGIQKLHVGDRIVVVGSTQTYVYAVESVNSADAKSSAIPLTVDGSKLTLATCDSFGTPTDRFVVVASLVESTPIGS